MCHHYHLTIIVGFCQDFASDSAFDHVAICHFDTQILPLYHIEQVCLMKSHMLCYTRVSYLVI